MGSIIVGLLVVIAILLHNISNHLFSILLEIEKYTPGEEPDPYD